MGSCAAELAHCPVHWSSCGLCCDPSQDWANHCHHHCLEYGSGTSTQLLHHQPCCGLVAMVLLYCICLPQVHHCCNGAAAPEGFGLGLNFGICFVGAAAEMYLLQSCHTMRQQNSFLALCSIHATRMICGELRVTGNKNDMWGIKSFLYLYTCVLDCQACDADALAKCSFIKCIGPLYCCCLCDCQGASLHVHFGFAFA